MNEINFTFSDLIAGYVTGSDAAKKTFGLKTSDGRQFQVKLTDATYAEMVRNLGEPYQDPGQSIDSMLETGRYLYAYGIYYPENNDHIFEAKHIVFLGKEPGEFRFEAPDWWIQQINSLAEFYRNAQFPDGNIDYRNYRTHLTLEGQQIDSTRQETDTISRMVYGFASAYLLTGDDRWLEVAERGTEYLRDHLRGLNEEEGFCFWYHGMDVRGGKERKILASQFGDDFDAIPAYEQIYALAGPVQTYRATGDPRIYKDAEMTVKLFDKYFLDKEKGGYFSHLDPVNFDPRAESLGMDRARKNWNSVGDHAPAYLINLWLATGEERYLDFLVYTGDTIEKYFKNYESSSFVQEKFFEDWSHDEHWGWQQNRGVCGHNLKIAWNLMRIHHVRPNEKYVAFARKIAEVMPKVGMDVQRGGWYDVMERKVAPGEQYHRYVWHDRKAWWQQEQGILAYLILAGSLKDPEYARLARESSAFYNAWFPDHDSGGVYFNVLANGLPYLLGTERLKGSHSMSGYHSFELCYLAAVYTNLLIMKQPMDFYFKPQPGGFKDNILRVQPDILPKGSVRIQSVWINGQPYDDFDADELTVKLPGGGAPAALKQRPGWASSRVTAQKGDLRVRVRLVPAGVTSDARLETSGNRTTLTLSGNLNADAQADLRAHLERAVATQPDRLVLDVSGVQAISTECVRALIFAERHLSVDVDTYVVGANPAVKQAMAKDGFLEETTTVDSLTQVPGA